MHFNKAATMLSVSVIEIEATNLARETPGLKETGLAKGEFAAAKH
jgi:hypothetical protein